MKTLLLLRHAKSSRDDPKLADHERPLNGRGKEAAKAVGRMLRDERLVPGLILSSTALRARKTAEKAAKKSGYDKAVQLDERLYLAAPAGYIAVIREAPAQRDRVLVVGHNPGITELLKRLTDCDEELPTAAVARIQLALKNWNELTSKTPAKLISIWRPRDLDE